MEDHGIIELLDNLRINFGLSTDAKIRSDNYIRQRLSEHPQELERYFDTLARWENRTRTLPPQQRPDLSKYYNHAIKRFTSDGTINIQKEATSAFIQNDLSGLKHLVFMGYSALSPEELRIEDFYFLRGNFQDLQVVSDQLDRRPFEIAMEHGEWALTEDEEFLIIIEGKIRARENEIQRSRENNEGSSDYYAKEKGF